jgi:aldehyde dehydrogenase (NAD+)
LDNHSAKIITKNIKTTVMKTIIDQQKQYFNSNQTKPAAFRKEQLIKLRSVLKSYEQELTAAVFSDFQKGSFNTFLTEFSGLYAELDNAIRNVEKWAKTKRVRTNMANSPAGSYLIPEPLGVCLVMGAWNYPINLALAPAIAAIAAGNTVVLKPSELTAHTSAVLAKMVRENFDPSFFTVVEGGIPETTELLAQKFDKIFFTGSVGVGKIVYQAAVKHLTPVTLELGGKSPLIVAADANLTICVKRLVWGKFVNAGQTCVAPDYVYVHKDIEKKFLEMMKEEIEQAQFSLKNENYAQIINDKHLDRLISMIDPAKVFTGGKYDRSNRVLAPTILNNISIDDPIMEDEIFGPVLPVLTYENINDVIRYVKSRPKPLALYLFTESSRLGKQVLEEVSFGGGGINEVLMHFSNDNLPFGGVGNSGMGSYHGEAGFSSFTHYKSILKKNTLFELPLKYYPYRKWKFSLLKRIMG